VTGAINCKRSGITIITNHNSTYGPTSRISVPVMHERCIGVPKICSRRPSLVSTGLVGLPTLFATHYFRILVCEELMT
jgi:hypothetical protein